MSSINAYSINNNYNFISSMFNTNNSNKQKADPMLSVINQFSDYKVLTTLGNKAIGKLINNPDSNIKLPEIPSSDDNFITGDTEAITVPVVTLPAYGVEKPTGEDSTELLVSQTKSYSSEITRDDTGIKSLQVYV